VALWLFTATVAAQAIHTSRFGAIPDDDISDTRAFQAALSTVQSGDTLLIDLPGTYVLDLDHAALTNQSVLFLQNKSGVTIEAVPGVVLEFVNYDRTTGGWQGVSPGTPYFLRAWGCDHLTVGGQLASAPLEVRMRKASGSGVEGLPFLQGKVHSVVPADGSTFVSMSIDSDFHLPAGAVAGEVWGAWEFVDGQPRNPTYSRGQGGTTVVAGPVSPSGLQTIGVVFSAPMHRGPALWQPGSSAVLSLGDTSQAFLSTAGGRDLLVRNMNVRSWPGKAMMGAFRGGVVDNFNVIPQEPHYLLSANRDGMSNQDSYELLTVRNCTMVRTGDDAFAITGGGLALVGDDGVQLDRVGLERSSLNYQGGTFRPGDGVLFCDPWYSPGSRTSNAATSLSATWGGDPDSLGLLSPMRVATGDLLINGSSWAGLVFEDNTIESPRGVGLRCNIPDTRVSRSRFHDTFVGAILLGGYGRLDAGYPYDAGPTFLYNTHSVIEDCHFIRATPDTESTSRSIKAAVSIDCPTGTDGVPFSGKFTYSDLYGVITGSVEIRGNRFEDSARGGVFASNVENLVLSGNTFVRVGELEPPDEGYHWEARGWPVYALRSNVDLSDGGNTFEDTFGRGIATVE